MPTTNQDTSMRVSLACSYQDQRELGRGRKPAGTILPKLCDVPCLWPVSGRKVEQMIASSVVIDGSCDNAEGRNGVDLCHPSVTHMTQYSVFDRLVPVEFPCHPSVHLPISILTRRYGGDSGSTTGSER
jgi:hypothetical protein